MEQTQGPNISNDREKESLTLKIKEKTWKGNSRLWCWEQRTAKLHELMSTVPSSPGFSSTLTPEEKDRNAWFPLSPRHTQRLGTYEGIRNGLWTCSNALRTRQAEAERCHGSFPLRGYKTEAKVRSTSQGQRWDSTRSKHKLHPGKDEEGKWEKRGSKSPPPHMCVTNKNNATQTPPSDHHPSEGKTAKVVREKTFYYGSEWGSPDLRFPIGTKDLTQENGGAASIGWGQWLYKSHSNNPVREQNKDTGGLQTYNFSQAFVFLERRSCYVILADCTCYMAYTGLKLMVILLPQPPSARTTGLHGHTGFYMFFRIFFLNLFKDIF